MAPGEHNGSGNSFQTNGQGRAVNTRYVHVALGVKMYGEKEILGVWVARTEGGTFWPKMILRELKYRGLQDFLIACVDGLKGFGEAIGPLPQT